MNDPSDGVFAPSLRALTLGILVSITAVAFEGMAVATIMPSVAVDLGGLEAYGWAFSVFMLASLMGATSSGEVVDRRGLMPPALTGFGAFAVGLLLSGMAPDWPLLLAGRAVQGLGAGALGSVAYVAVARGYPELLRPRLLALLASAWVIPSLVGPAIAGQVAEHATWRLVFFGLMPLVGIGAWMLLPSLQRLPSRVSVCASIHVAAAGAQDDASVDSLLGAPPDSLLGAPPARASGRVLLSLRLMLGVALVLLAANLTYLPASLAVVAIGLLLAVPGLRGLLPRGTFTAGNGLPSAVGLRALLAFGFFGAEAVIPLGLSTERGVPPSVVGIALTAGALAWVAASWVQDRAESAARGSLQRRAMRAVGGLVLLGAGIGSAAFAVVVPSLPLAVVIVGWAVAGLGMGLTYPATTLTALGLAARGEDGRASAALQVAETVGIATGTGAAGALYALAAHLERPATDGLAWAFAIALASIVLAVAAGARLAPARVRGGRASTPHTAEPAALA